MRRRILSRANDLTGHTCAGCGLPIHGAATVISDSAGGRTYYHRGHRLSDWKILEEDLREFLRGTDRKDLSDPQGSTSEA